MLVDQGQTNTPHLCVQEKEQEKLNLGEFNVKKKHPGEKEKTEEPLPKGNT